MLRTISTDRPKTAGVVIETISMKSGSIALLSENDYELSVSLRDQNLVTKNKIKGFSRNQFNQESVS